MSSEVAGSSYSTEPTGFINYRYFISPPGILKLVEVVFCSICFGTASPPYLGVNIFLLVVAYLTLACNCAWIVIYLFNINTKFEHPKFSWPIVELLYNAVAMFLYALAVTSQFAVLSLPNSALVVVHPGITDEVPRFFASASFGLMNSIVHGLSAVFVFNRR